jgi:hypothetical protein
MRITVRGWCGWCLSLCIAIPCGLTAQSVDPAWGPKNEAASPAPPPLQLAAAATMAPLARLRPASEGAKDQLEAMALWNRQRHARPQNGFARLLARPVEIGLPNGLAAPPSRQPFAGGYLVSAAGGTGLAWGAAVEVAGAYRLRLHLAKVQLPAGTRMWVYGRSDTPQEFGLELRGPGGDLWTPSVAGERLYFEVQLPLREAHGDASLTFDQVLEIFRLTGPGEPALEPPIEPALTTACLVDASCVSTASFSAIDFARHAMAQLLFVEGGQGFLCSGGLLNDAAGDFIPYLLTANHCISDSATAATLDAFWDYFTPSCGGPSPNEATLPRSHGAALLATGARGGGQSDFTLLRLNGIPGGRAFMGWNANSTAVAQGVALYRISHPAPAGVPLPQGYSVSLVNTSFAGCQGVAPRPTFIYSSVSIGDVFGGSSGSPVTLANGQVVGQLLGACGPTAINYPGCDPSDAIVDGAFAATYPSVAPYLNPGTTGGACTPGATTLCIDDQAGDRRFEIRVHYSSPGRHLDGDGTAVSLSSLGITAGGAFGFFSAANPELLIKVLNACGLGQHWVFFAAVTDVGFTVTVRDTVAGKTKAYSNNDGQPAAPVQDTSAFACP